ncbi:MAG: hypothetical protein H5T86_11420 [Armatimonadetes bacterium]|nr:hypothetical protein [Armatimonadota bacterium]
MVKLASAAVLAVAALTAGRAAAAGIKCLGAFGSPEHIWKLGKKLSDFHINAVFLGHGALNPEVIERCRQEGARVFAELGIFVGKQVAQEHPELWPINADGKPLEPDEWYLGLCPNVDWWWENRLEEIEKIARENEIDGLWLDFIRYPCHWEVPEPRIEQACFCEESIRDFERMTGIAVPAGETAERAKWILANHEEEWTEFKCRTIAEFCRQARERLHKHRPNALLGMFSVPWTQDNYDDAIHKIIAQDFTMLARHIDVFSPMSYHAMCGWTVTWIGEYNRYLVQKTQRDVWPIVQAIDSPRPVSIEEFEQALRAGLSNGATGVMMFRLADCTPENGKLSAVQRVYAAALGT